MYSYLCEKVSQLLFCGIREGRGGKGKAKGRGQSGEWLLVRRYWLMVRGRDENVELRAEGKEGGNRQDGGILLELPDFTLDRNHAAVQYAEVSRDQPHRLDKTCHLRLAISVGYIL